MFYIDFAGGSHGNYLEFCCNKILAKIPTVGLPFSDNGSAHDRNYQQDRVFRAGHYFHSGPDLLKNSSVIAIRFIDDDLLPLSMVSLLRSGDYNLDNNKLEINTYIKLNNPMYYSVLSNIVDAYFSSYIKKSYNKVRDPSWPDVDTLDDFKKLPVYIQDECIHVHQIELLEFSLEQPNCPRHILRDFFKKGFKYPSQHGLTIKQNEMTYDHSNRVYTFPYGCFYDTEQFAEQLEDLRIWCGLDTFDKTELVKLHTEFLKRQIYKDSKTQCDAVINDIIANKTFELPTLDLFQESYINAKLELHYGQEIVETPTWFINSKQIIDYFNT
jgi:hypothetical protein